MADFFGDSEPEDSWHPDDPVVELLSNLLRRLALLRTGLQAVATQREQLRFDQFDDDLRFIIERLRDDG